MDISPIKPNPKQTDELFSITFDLARCLKEKLTMSSLYSYLVNRTATHPERPEWVIEGFSSSIKAQANIISDKIYLVVTLTKLSNVARDSKK